MSDINDHNGAHAVQSVRECDSSPKNIQQRFYNLLLQVTVLLTHLAAKCFSCHSLIPKLKTVQPLNPQLKRSGSVQILTHTGQSSSDKATFLQMFSGHLESASPKLT